MSQNSAQSETARSAVVPDVRASSADWDSLQHSEFLPGLHHVNLKTTRREEMTAWYTTVVGMKVVFEGSGGAWLSNDAANHRLALVSGETLRADLSDDVDKARHAGLYHTAWEYRSLDALLATYVRLKDLGIQPQRCVNHGPTTSFYYLDPDGNAVELQSDNFGDWASSRHFMAESPEFARDPFGPHVVPDLMIADRRAGVATEVVLRRAYGGEYKPDESVPPSDSTP